MKGDIFHAHFPYNFADTQQLLSGITSLIKETLENSISLTESTHCINKSILSSANDNDHISEVLYSPGGQIKIRVSPVLQRPRAKLNFLVDFQRISNMYSYKCPCRIYYRCTGISLTHTR
jgi:hypothetical protein